MTKLEIKLAEFFLALILLTGCYFWVRHDAVVDYQKEATIEQAKVDKAKQDAYNKLSEDYEALKTTRQANANTVTRTYEKVIEKPIYSTVCVEPDGLRLANEAIAGKRATQLDAKVPSDQTP